MIVYNTVVLGVVFGIPTGLIAYYGFLQSHVTLRQVVVIMCGSLIVGGVGGIIFGWFFAFATPLLTIYIAWGVQEIQLYKEVDESHRLVSRHLGCAVKRRWSTAGVNPPGN
jgi:hypothetical protein